MKYLLTALLLALSSASFGASINIFGGTGQTATGSVSAAQANNSAVSGPNFGTAGGTHTATSVNYGRALTFISPTGVTSAHEQYSGTNARGGNYSHGLSASAGGGNAFGGGLSGATGTFQTIGLGVTP